MMSGVRQDNTIDPSIIFVDPAGSIWSDSSETLLCFDFDSEKWSFFSKPENLDLSQSSINVIGKGLDLHLWVSFADLHSSSYVDL